MPARQITGKKPKHFWSTFRTLLAYMGRHKFLFLAVAVLVTISALGNLLGTYMIRPVVNSVGAGDAASARWGRWPPSATPRPWSMRRRRSSMTSGGTFLPTSSRCRCAFSTPSCTATS